MSMNVSISGYGSAELHNKYVKIVRLCRETDIEKLPDEVAGYFGTFDPEKVDECEGDEILIAGSIHKKECEYGDIWEIRLDELPAGVERIRVSYT